MRPTRGSATPLKVGDLFCGAGGFAEGFAQAGFRVVWGVDNWPPALETFKKNHPGAEGKVANIVSIRPEELEPVDVLIGSPPCVHFSPANRGGNGDRMIGMRLVRRFLTLVRALRPKYWVMENVPALLPHLLEGMAHDEIALNSGHLRIPVRTQFDAARFGTPQTRKRLFCGDFPEPVPTHDYEGGKVIPLRRILEALPDPVRPAGPRPLMVDDPVYEGCRVQASSLRDHFEDSRWALSRQEVESSEDKRLRDRIYGAMPFPDSVDRPARTITATKTRGSRATIVIPWASRAEPPYRTLTLRECASAQGFPLTYQFWGSSMSVKDALVGNAVPPPMARAIAEAILIKEDRPVPPAPILRLVGALPPVLSLRRNGPKRFSMRRRFRGILPVDWRHDHPVELDNEPPPRAKGESPDSIAHLEIRWRARIYLGYAKLYKCYELPFADALRLASAVAEDDEVGAPEGPLVSTLSTTVQRCLDGFPDGLSLQAQWAKREEETFGPREILRFATRTIDQNLPHAKWKETLVSARLTEPILGSSPSAQGTDTNPGQPLEMSVRLVAGAIVLSVICERLNHGSKALDELMGKLVSGRIFARPSENGPMARPAQRRSVDEVKVRA